ncbi:hypothetical protein AA313_de0208487 [Arthrobotrys entomopaga]|nr:hypothetical protein AA313_de0208487 [Arthrobotrys entomopaga]
MGLGKKNPGTKDRPSTTGSITQARQTSTNQPRSGGAPTPNRTAPSNNPSPQQPLPGQVSAENGTPTPSQPQNANGSDRYRNQYYYKAPGCLADLSKDDDARLKWSNSIDKIYQDLIDERLSPENNEIIKSYNPARVRKNHYKSFSNKIKWRAFPQNVELLHVHAGGTQWDKYAEADIRDTQDEYCEWEVIKVGGHLKSVTFTCELIEYWEYLASTDPQFLLKLYREFNPDADISLQDLLDAEGKKYNPKNKWNCRGTATNGQATEGAIMHMIGVNNTLTDAASLVLDSTIARFNADGVQISDGAALLRSMKVSDASPKRNSDPAITKTINDYSKKGKLVTITNPLGVFIDTFDADDFIAPGGEKVSQFWKRERVGSDETTVRAKFEIPDKFLGKIRHKKTSRVLKYGSQLAESLWIGVACAVSEQEPQANTSEPIWSYIEGRQIKPTLVSKKLLEESLHVEPFGQYLAQTKNPAITLDELVRTYLFKDHPWVAYAADEGLGFYTKKTRVRLVLVSLPDCNMPLGSAGDGPKMADPNKLTEYAFDEATIFVVALPPFNDPTNMNSDRCILQVASYHPDLGYFNFYDREPTGEHRWLYFGCSKDAFAADTFGIGPFCGHPNGGLIMKEMEEPWLHWHSTTFSLDLPDDHPLSKDPLFRHPDSGIWHFTHANHMAHLVRTGTERWFQKRLSIDLGPRRQRFEEAQRVNQWISHICLNTTIEIAASKSLLQSNSDSDSSFSVPSGFFFNIEALQIGIDGLVGRLGLECYNPLGKYTEAAENFGLWIIEEFKSKDGEEDILAFKGEGSVPWIVAVPSGEDVTGISQVVAANLLPKNVVTAILLIDFWNPLFSARRAQIMKYIPSTVRHVKPGTDDAYDLGVDLIEVVRKRIIAQQLGGESPESELIRNYDEIAKDPSWAAQRLVQYIGKVKEHIKSPNGVLDYVKVAETRRRMVRPPRRTGKPPHPLAEFDMSLPYATEMDKKFQENWVMREDGQVENLAPSNSVWHPRNNQTSFAAAGCPFSQLA